MLAEWWLKESWVEIWGKMVSYGMIHTIQNRPFSCQNGPFSQNGPSNFAQVWRALLISLPTHGGKG